MHLEPPDSRLHRFALHFAVSGISAGAHGFPNDYQIAAPLAECLEAGLVSTAQRRCCSRCRNLRDLRRAGCAGLRRKAAERFADNTVALTRPHLGGAMMPMVPPVGGRVGSGERKTRSALALTVKNEVQGIV